MADNIITKEINNKIDKLINSGRFNESFLLLKNRMKDVPELQKNLDKLQATEAKYKYFLTFIASGGTDPSQKEVMEQIKEDLFEANDTLLRFSLLIDSSDLYSSTKRMEVLHQTNFDSTFQSFLAAFENDSKIEGRVSPYISPQQARCLQEIFNYIWTGYQLPSEDIEKINSVLNDGNLPEYLKDQIVSALLLANISYFDPSSFEILLNQAESSDLVSVKARALTGVVLISLLYPQRVAGNLNLRSHLIMSGSDEDLTKAYNEVLINIIRTFDTKRVDSKMRNEVIPGLMKLKPEIIDKMKNMASDSENFLSDTNPDWEEMLESSDIGAKLREINDMQMDGADVMVTAFSNLKGFSFFIPAANWFLPFIPGYFEYDELPIDQSSENISRLTSVMCDSDLHSFLLSLKSMPSDNRNQMLQNMENQMKEAKEALGNSIGDTEAQLITKKIRQSLQDLYRFFKFYRRKQDFKDPLASPVLSSNIEPVRDLLGFTTESIRLVAEFYFKNKYYREAVDLLEYVDKLSPGDFSIWEKIAYSNDRLQQYETAVEWYQKAELINPNNKWLIKNLAIALKNAGKPVEAFNYYKKALENDSENYHLLMSAAQCLIDSKNFEEARKHLYHAQYLKPDKLAPLRAIAWLELLDHNHDKANELYVKISVNPEADKTDFLNAAHNHLANGNFKEALKNYSIFIDKTPSKDIKELVIAFREDSETLKYLNIKTSDLRLIIDMLRYDIMN